MRASALPGLVLLALVGALVASVACSNQAEGQFCDTANGNNDCQDGLQCQKAPGVTAGVNQDRCCPIPPAAPTTPECSLNTGALVDASTEVGDVMVGPEGAAEAGNSGEAGAEASVAEASAAEASAEASAAEASTDSGPDAGSPDALPE